jgi:hypothetical protein
MRLSLFISLVLLATTSWAQQETVSEPTSPEATTVSEWLGEVTSAGSYKMRIGLEYGVGTLQFSGSKTDEFSSTGDYRETSLLGVNFDLPTSPRFSLITGIRRETLEWQYDSSVPNSLPGTRFKNQYLGIPVAIRGYIGSSIVRPYIQAGVLVSHLTNSSTNVITVSGPESRNSKHSFRTVSVRGEVELGANAALTKTVHFGVGIRGTTSLQDEIKAIENTQKITGVAGTTNLSVVF